MSTKAAKFTTVKYNRRPKRSNHNNVTNKTTFNYVVKKTVLTVPYDGFVKSCRDGVAAQFNCQKNRDYLTNLQKGDEFEMTLLNNDFTATIVKLIFDRIVIVENSESDASLTAQLREKYDWKAMSPKMSTNWGIIIYFQPTDENAVLL